MAPLIPYYYLFEIDDQPWFPSFLRARVQSCLTFYWNLHFPILQPASPAALVARVLHEQLGRRARTFTYVDFCSGAGGPLPAIERSLNGRLRESAPDFAAPPHGAANGVVESPDAMDDQASGGMDFVLTDIAPHPRAWAAAAKKSAHIHYVDRPVDAANAPVDLLDQSTLSGPGKARPVFRLFNLAFHHFEDAAARRLLANTLTTASGFAIFELQGRSLAQLVTMFLASPVLVLATPFAFYADWTHLFWTFVLPVVPLVVLFDGLVSCLRTRTGPEVRAMVESVREEIGTEKTGEWVIKWGTLCHTWPTGSLEWVVAMKKEDGFA